jgi:hypothetical protein
MVMGDGRERIDPSVKVSRVINVWEGLTYVHVMVNHAR